MRCYHCGEYIDTRFREADGSVICPGCGANYRPKAKAPEEGKTIRVDRDTYQRQSLVKQRPMPSVVSSQQSKSGKRKLSFFQSAVLAVLLLFAATASALLLYEKYSDDEIPKFISFSTDFLTDAKQKLLSLKKRNSEHSSQEPVGQNITDKVLPVIGRNTDTEEEPILDVYKLIQQATDYIDEAQDKKTQETNDNKDSHINNMVGVEIDAAYKQAYINLLFENRTTINSCYDEIKNATGKNYNAAIKALEEQLFCPIAMCDIYGDETPELIYVITTSPTYYMNLHIVTYEDNKIKELYSCECGGGGGGVNYYLFKIKDSNDLHICTIFQNADLSVHHKVLKATEDDILYESPLLDFATRNRGTTLPYSESYKVYGNEVSASEYQSAFELLNTLTEEILTYTSNCGEFVDSFVAHNGSTGMTCDQAISYLSGFYKSQNNLKAILDDSYLGTRYEQVSGYDDPAYSNTIEIHNINNDGTVLFSLSFLRLRGFDNLVAYLIDEGTGIFYDVRSGFSGLLDFSDGNVILSIEDTPNFYFDHSSVQFFGGHGVRVFSPR